MRFITRTNWKARPDFSPDGSRMIYSSYLAAMHHLWVMPAKAAMRFLSYGDLGTKQMCAVRTGNNLRHFNEVKTRVVGKTFPRSTPIEVPNAVSRRR